jgi:hypothetical protein
MSVKQIGPTSAYELPGQLRKGQSKRDAMSALNQTKCQLGHERPKYMVHDRPSPWFMRCHVIIWSYVSTQCARSSKEGVRMAG